MAHGGGQVGRADEDAVHAVRRRDLGKLRQGRAGFHLDQDADLVLGAVQVILGNKLLFDYVTGLMPYARSSSWKRTQTEGAVRYGVAVLARYDRSSERALECLRKKQEAYT